MQNQTQFSPEELERITVSTTLNTLAYAISSDDTYLIGKNVNEIIQIKINEFEDRKSALEDERTDLTPELFTKTEAQLADDITNLSAVMAFVLKNPYICEIKLKATSGMFRRNENENNNNNNNENDNENDNEKFVRDFNSGVNTFRFFDETNNRIINAERGTFAGEWGDNQYIATNALTGQNIQALDIRKRFDENDGIPKHPDASVIETGHSKGGHKALVCHLYNITQKINEFNNDPNKNFNQKVSAVNDILNKNYCIFEDAPSLSNETLKFFQEQLQPAYESGIISRPEIFIKQTLANSIIRVNCKNDYVSAINESNALGKAYISQQTHNTVTGAHAIRTLCGARRSKDGFLIFTGEVPKPTEKYGSAHKAAGNFFEKVNNLPKESKDNALGYFMSTLDSAINKTNIDVHGSTYYGALNSDEQVQINKAKSEDMATIIPVALKMLFTKEMIPIMKKMVGKSPTVNSDKNFQMFSSKFTQEQPLQSQQHLHCHPLSSLESNQVDDNVQRPLKKTKQKSKNSLEKTSKKHNHKHKHKHKNK